MNWTSNFAIEPLTYQIFPLQDIIAFEIYATIVSMGPIAFSIIGSIPSLITKGTLPSSDDPLFYGYKITRWPSYPFLFWLLICTVTPDRWVSMERWFNLSLWGPLWLYIFAPFLDTLFYVLAFANQEYILLKEPEYILTHWFKITVIGMCFWTTIFTFSGARRHIRFMEELVYEVLREEEEANKPIPASVNDRDAEDDHWIIFRI